MVNPTLIQNMFLGIAVGDSAGAGLEYQSGADIQRLLQWGEYQTFRPADHSEGFALGRYTDDTEHSLAVARLVADYRSGVLRTVNADTFYDYFTTEYDWFKNLHGFGRGGHGSFGDAVEGKKTLAEVRESQASRVHPGNAPPMRALPIGFLPPHEIDDFALWNAHSTHPHPEGVAASAAIAWAAHYLLVQGIDQAEILRRVIPHLKDSFTRDLFGVVDQLAWPLSPGDVEKLLGPQPITPFFAKERQIIGLPCESGRTAAAALYVAKHAKSATEGIQQSLFLGGDVDSLAAIVGGLIAARYGVADLPVTYITGLEHRDYLLQIAARFAQAVS